MRTLSRCSDAGVVDFLGFAPVERFLAIGDPVMHRKVVHFLLIGEPQGVNFAVPSRDNQGEVIAEK